MLNYTSLESKPLIVLKDKNGNDTKCFDLLSDTIRKDIDQFGTFTFIKVTNDYIARPDLISLAVYGTDMYGDIICKINGISNPFELNSGIILIIPDLSSANKMYTTGIPSALINSNEDHISTTKKGFQKTKHEPRNTNEQVIGDKNFIIDLTNKMVIY